MWYFSYLQENGYKPTPLDLSQTSLNKRMVELVELLAENTHNVWAKDRIKQGWTYGLHEVRVRFHMIPLTIHVVPNRLHFWMSMLSSTRGGP